MSPSGGMANGAINSSRCAVRPGRVVRAHKIASAVPPTPASAVAALAGSQRARGLAGTGAVASGGRSIVLVMGFLFPVVRCCLAVEGLVPLLGDRALLVKHRLVD